jgi:hypothetical protein
MEASHGTEHSAKKISQLYFSAKMAVSCKKHLRFCLPVCRELAAMNCNRMEASHGTEHSAEKISLFS